MSERAPHPGKVLKGTLADMGILQLDLAFILGVATQTVNAIINGRRDVDAEMSKALGVALGMPPGYFADIQKAYDLAQAEDPDPAVRARADIVHTFPIREMLNRGWLPEGGGDDLRSRLAQFFDVADPEDVPYMPHAAKKTSYELKEIPPSQLVWLFRVRQIASRMVSPPYSARDLAETVRKLRTLTSDVEGARYIPRLLSGCGVRLVVVEPLPSAKIDGVTFWLGPTTPVIGLSLRFDRIDNLWFVLRHEIEHVLRRHGLTDPMMDSDIETQEAVAITEEERVANDAASDFCAPSDKFRSWMNRHSPIPSERDVLAFAALHRIHPGLVVGQTQQRLRRYDYLRKYQVKVRHVVLPTAMVDGFGYSAPF
jgi:HTH-type transcriptional regulator / antitoxin HigA